MKDSLIKGTIILAAAALVARVLGVIQRIPLQRLLDDSGMATYGIAYNVYFWLLIVATAGFPSAVAKLVSEKYAVGRPEEGEQIRKAANRFALATGVAATLLVFGFAPWYARLSGDPGATLAIRALAPALLLFPWIAVERGYFQSRRMMSANGLSQIWEQIFRVITAVLLAYWLLQLGYGINLAAAGASFGGVLGALSAAAVMLIWQRKLKRLDQQEAEDHAKKYGKSGAANTTGASSEDASTANTASSAGAAKVAGAASADMPDAPVTSSTVLDTIQSGEKITLKSIYRAIFKLSIPVSLTALAVPTVFLIDSTVTIRLLENQLGTETAKELLGMLTARAQSLAGIPVIFAIALSQSILPIISSSFVQGNKEELVKQTSQALRLTLLSGAPAVVVLCAAAFPLNTLIFGDAFGTWVIMFLVASSIFQVLMMTSGSILLGIGLPAAPMRNIGIGIACKFAVSFALSPFIGIWGIVGGTALCFAVTASLNLRELRRHVPYVTLGGRALPFIATVSVQLAVGGGIAWLLYTYVNPFSAAILNALLQTAVISAIAAAIYPVLLLRTGTLTAADIAAMPGAVRKLWNRAEPVMRKLRMY